MVAHCAPTLPGIGGANFEDGHGQGLCDLAAIEARDNLPCGAWWRSQVRKGQWVGGYRLIKARGPVQGRFA